MLNLIRKSRGILGMNARNLSYVRPYNSTKAIELANNKLRSKKVLFAASIPVPEVYGVIIPIGYHPFPIIFLTPARTFIPKE
jgi:hypothetical protein